MKTYKDQQRRKRARHLKVIELLLLATENEKLVADRALAFLKELNARGYCLRQHKKSSVHDLDYELSRLPRLVKERKQ